MGLFDGFTFFYRETRFSQKQYAIPTPNILALSPYEDDILAGGWSRDLMRLSAKQTIQVWETYLPPENLLYFEEDLTSD